MITICKWGQKGIWILFPAWLYWVLLGKQSWLCGLELKAVQRSSHLPPLTSGDVTALSSHCSWWALFKPPFLPFLGCPQFFPQWGDLVSVLLPSSPWGWIHLHIHYLHLMPILLDLVTVWYLDCFRASQSPVWVTCKCKKTMQLMIWIITFCNHSWPRTGLVWKEGCSVRVKTCCWHSMTEFEKLIWQINYDANIHLYRWRSKGQLGHTESPFVAFSWTSNPSFKRVNCHLFQALLMHK